MLSIAVIKSPDGIGSYYERESGKDNYWARDARESSQWLGRGAQAQGLSGPVRQLDFVRAMEGRLPDGRQLPHGAGGNRRAGYDLTFSAPKSVSLAGIVGRDERVIAAHDAAVKRAFEYLEREAAITRIKANGEIAAERTGNLSAAAFRHETSRAGDPQLHTHVVVANMVKDQHGHWRALASEELFRHKMAAGAIYRAELGKQLIRYGYHLRQTRHGFEVREISDKQIAAFSQRRAEIAARLAADGQSGARAAEVAALDTRHAKQAFDSAERAESWQRTAERAGLSLENITAQARARWHYDHGETKDVAEKLAARMADQREAVRESVSHAIEHLSERQSVFHRRDILRHAAAHGAWRGVDLRSLEREVDRRLNERELVRAGERLTTREALQAEIRTIRAMRQGKQSCSPIQADARRMEELSKGLTEGQRAALRLSLQTRDQIIGIEGKAGTGKTTMLQRIVQEAQAQGYQVRGLAPSAQAAKVLEQETGAQSQTLSKHLMQQAQGGGKQIWIVDEAGMMSSRQADRLMAQARQAGARVILVGDRQQLAAVEAGKPLATLANKGMEVARMDEIMRQRDATLKRAVEQIVQKRGREAIQTLDKSIGQIEDRGERLEAAARSWLGRSEHERQGTMVIVETNADRRELNAAIRAGLRAEGKLHGPEVEVRALEKTGMTRAQLRETHNYEQGMVVRFGRAYRSLGVERGEALEVAGRDEQGRVILRRENGEQVAWNPAQTVKVEAFRAREIQLQAGDQILFTRNEYELGRLNGRTAEVLSIDPEAREARIRVNGEEQTLRLDDPRHQTITHAYACTVHASQGATCDRAIMAVDTERAMASEQSVYVGISRAREGVEILTDDREQLAELAGREDVQESAYEAVQDSGHSPEGSLQAEYHGGGGGAAVGAEVGAEVEIEAGV